MNIAPQTGFDRVSFILKKRLNYRFLKPQTVESAIVLLEAFLVMTKALKQFEHK